MSAADIKYLADGRIVRVLAYPSADRIVVEIGHVHEDDLDGELFFEGTEIVSHVYDRPLTDALSKEVRELEDRLNALRDSVRRLAEQECDARRRVEKLKVYSQLERVEDFLAGKITHYVTWTERHRDVPIPAVSAVKDERCGSASNSYTPLKLLVLFGSADRTLAWKLNHYSDGSGHHRHCIPCCSLEEAEAKAREILAGSFAKFKFPPFGSSVRDAEDLLSAARVLSVQVPDNFEITLQAHQVHNIEVEIEKCAAERERWAQRLANLKRTHEGQS